MGRPRPKEIVLFLAPIVAVGVIVFLLFCFQEQQVTYTLSREGAQYYRGSRYQIDEDTTLRRTEEGETVMEVGNYDYTLSQLPVYYEGNRILFPQDMLYVDPRTETALRIPYFSEVYLGSDGLIYASWEGEEVELSRGFLYDGRDTYFCLEPMTLTFNGYAIYLSTFSYVEAIYTYEVTAFNYGAMETITEVPMGQVTLRPEAGAYEVSLLTDVVTVDNGTTTLLFSRPDQIDSIF